MKKFLGFALAVVMSLSTLLFAVACGDNDDGDEMGDTNPKETVIDFDTGEYSAEDYFSVESSTTSTPITKSNILSGFVQYSATGTVTVKIEPISTYTMKLDDVSLDVEIYVGISPRTQEWKFAEGGDVERDYQKKKINTRLSANGTATITENLKLGFVLSTWESLTFNENSLKEPLIFIVSLLNPHGKITLYSD